ncbi:uncharacterized protein LOC129594551 isoform X2 [Paramacrobiotus metropolitanus]|uniref:uncharacterized protein LOC129594551 isoform X2 n=1 Tax=Paramacrobiotus metropolitanus TaxID=2943436 RepID=UPI0024463A9D|nr:uncharacterized protein LOC129594551 isoform X2 [Paramacrobiotus metropolitanus]
MFGFPFRRNWGIAKFRPPFPYTLEEPIGHGGLSRAVYKVTDESSEETYAVKAIPVISGTPDAELRKHLHEFKTIVKLSARPHRNVVRYYYFDVARWDAGPEVRLFMEYCNGHNLAGRNESLAASKQRLKEHDIVRDLKDILRGLQYLHRNGIVHLDIKGGNILITTTGVVKLADFGLITKIQGAVTASGEVNGAAGTTVYMAPERFSGVFGRCGRASDVWSVGCVLLEMLHGHAPRFYRRESRGKMMLMVRLPEIEAALATGEKPCYFHPGSKEDPQKLGRKGCHDSKEFLRTGKDFLDSCFRLTAADRPTAAALLQHPLLTGRDLQEYHQKVEVPLTSAAIGAEPRWRGMLQWIAQSLLPKNPPSGLAPLCTGCRRIQQVNSDIFHWLVRSPDSKYCASCWAKVCSQANGSKALRWK